MRLFLRILRLLSAFVMFVLALIALTELSPIYDFPDPAPFTGASVYNPYEGFNSDNGWKKANFHTHTRAHKWFNECEFEADSVIAMYRRFGYDIVSVSNHMEITPAGLVPAYEHGWNVCKLHNLVIGARKVNYLDCFCPFLTSQQQFKIDRLLANADFVFQNHPDRINFMDEEDMSKLTGYRLVEADCGFDLSSTNGRKWDAALSAGHYVPSAISDDLHRPQSTSHFGRRCNFINCETESYADVRAALLAGRFYSMHLPDFVEGDMDAKLSAHRSLPAIESIGLTDSLDVFINLSRKAASIEAIGQNGMQLEMLQNADSLSYRFTPEDTYVRVVARFDDGSVLYTNPFVRWSGSSESGTPYYTASHPVNWPLTVLFNLLVSVIAAAFIQLGIALLKKR